MLIPLKVNWGVYSKNIQRINWKQNQLIPCWLFIKPLDSFFFLNYYYLHVQMQKKSLFKNKVKGQTLTLSSVGTALMWCLRLCSGQHSTAEWGAFLFCFDFFWGSNSYRVKDPLMSCLETLKQTLVFSDSSGTCISLHFCISLLLAFCHGRCLQGKRIIIINFKEVICSCFISLSLLESLFSVCDIKIFAVEVFIISKIEEHDIMQENNSRSWGTFKGALIFIFYFLKLWFELCYAE